MEDDLIPLDIIDDFLSEHVSPSNLMPQSEALFEPNVDQNIGNSSNLINSHFFLKLMICLVYVQSQNIP